MRWVWALLSVGAIFGLAELWDGLRGIDPYRLGAFGLVGPSLAHPLGTDDLGRDLLSRVLHGGRTSMLVGGLAALLSTSLGGLIGVSAGLFGGRLEQGLMSLTDALLSLPKLPVLVGLSLVQSSGTVFEELVILALLIAAFSWPDVARTMRGVAQSFRTAAYFEVGLAVGVSKLGLLLRHGLHPLAAPLAVSFTHELAQAILFESTLSFLGLGIRPPTPSLGQLLSVSLYGLTSAPHQVLAPGFATVLVVGLVYRVGTVVSERVGSRIGPS